MAENRGAGLEVRLAQAGPIPLAVVLACASGEVLAYAGSADFWNEEDGGQNDGTLTVGGWTFVGAVAGAVAGAAVDMQAGTGTGVEKWVAVDLEQLKGRRRLRRCRLRLAQTMPRRPRMWQVRWNLGRARRFKGLSLPICPRCPE